MRLDASLPAPSRPPRPAFGLWGTLRASFALIADNGPAGRMLRLMLWTSMLAIGISSPAIYAAHRLHYVGIAQGVALFAAINVVLVIVAALRGAWLINAEHTALMRLRSEVQNHALQDPQTGLANRGHFVDQLVRRAALANRRTNAPFAVCSLELDGMDEVASRLGEAISNRMVTKAAEVIRDCVRASDLVARLDGEKFGILLQEIADARDIDILAQRILSAVPPALEELAAGGPPITVSIGVVMKNSGRDRPGEILREADAALDVARLHGPGRFELTAFVG